jgi:ferric-dicitrate binding protein FerR (iron transport regulator)
LCRGLDDRKLFGMYLPVFRPIHLLICAAIAGSAVFAAEISAAQEVGVTSKVSGIAKLARGGKELDAVPAMPVAIGDRIRTMKSAQVSVTFTDGSIAELGESSSFTIDRYALSGAARKSGLLKLWRGKLRTIVKVATGSAPSFEVHTPNAVVAVRGTDFETAYIADRPCPEDRSCMRYTTVGVSSGVVAVSNPSNSAPPLEVREGYETTVACESAATPPAPLGMEGLGAPGYH